jgi:hypothetical protein
MSISVVYIHFDVYNWNFDILTVGNFEVDKKRNDTQQNLKRLEFVFLIRD